jgi:hypothetical protein
MDLMGLESIGYDGAGLWGVSSVFDLGAGDRKKVKM